MFSFFYFPHLFFNLNTKIPLLFYFSLFSFFGFSSRFSKSLHIPPVSSKTWYKMQTQIANNKSSQIHGIRHEVSMIKKLKFTIYTYNHNQKITFKERLREIMHKMCWIIMFKQHFLHLMSTRAYQAVSRVISRQFMFQFVTVTVTVHRWLDIGHQSGCTRYQVRLHTISQPKKKTPMRDKTNYYCYLIK